MRLISTHNQFDSSDEDDVVENAERLKIDWISLIDSPIESSLAITCLPGCKIGNIQRNLQQDFARIKQASVQDIFIFCTSHELRRYQVSTLLQRYAEEGLVVHPFPYEIDDVPTKQQILTVIQELLYCFYHQRKCLLHCHDGMGRSCLVMAVFMLCLDETLTPNDAIDKLKQVRGSCAIQTIKQYNFIHGFRELMKEFLPELSGSLGSLRVKERRLSR